MHLLHDDATHRGDTESNCDFGEQLLAGWLIKLGEHRKPVAEKRNHREDSANLDYDVKNIAPKKAVGIDLQQMLCDEQMARRGYGDEFREAFNEAQNDGKQPVRHRKSGKPRLEETRVRRQSFLKW